MEIKTVREFCEDASSVLGAKGPILLTRRGRLAGVFLPLAETTLPVAVKRQIFVALSADVARQAHKRGFNDDEILADFDLWGKVKRQVAEPRERVGRMSKLEAKRLQQFKDMMAKYGGKLQFAGYDK